MLLKAKILQDFDQAQYRDDSTYQQRICADLSQKQVLWKLGLLMLLIQLYVYIYMW